MKCGKTGMTVYRVRRASLFSSRAPYGFIRKRKSGRIVRIGALINKKKVCHNE